MDLAKCPSLNQYFPQSKKVLLEDGRIFLGSKNHRCLLAVAIITDHNTIDLMEVSMFAYNNIGYLLLSACCVQALV